MGVARQQYTGNITKVEKMLEKPLNVVKDRRVTGGNRFLNWNNGKDPDVHATD